VPHATRVAHPVSGRQTAARHMNNKEARSILAQQLGRYRSRSYAELATWARERRVDTPEVVTAGGARYQIEVQFFWDDKPERDVRVCGSIDDGGIRASKGFAHSLVRFAMERINQTMVEPRRLT
jgi:hypothetical protein